MPSLTLAEARARAALLTVDSYDIALDLCVGDDVFGCRTVVCFESAAAGAETFIDLVGARSVRATLNGRELNDVYADDRLFLTDLAERNELVVEATLPYVTTGDGMHRMTDPADDRTYVSAYCGMDIARTVFPCFDQPDLKATISLEVQADPTWTVVANGVASHDDGRWTFTTTPRISTYLFVVCAGPWHAVTWEHAGLPFGWYARASLAEALDAQVDELRRITERCFDHYTAIFDEPYPFDSYEQVMAPGQNWGALETPGCITYRDELLFRGTPTSEERMGQATVIAHEMAHMWFGNLVTMRWWEDTWLNESFADFMGYEVASEAAGYDLAWTSCAVGRKPTAYRADSRRSTHPVAPLAEGLVDVDTAMANFDMITYAKGNALLRQLQAWLGRDDFLTGTNRHLSRHAFGNATLADYLDSLDACTDRDVRGWADAWLLTTGFDTIEVRRDDEIPVVRRVGTRPHRLTVATIDDTGALVAEQRLDVGEVEVALPDFTGRPVLVNTNDETFARVRLDGDTREVVAQRLSDIPTPVTRAQLWAATVDMVLDARVAWTWLGNLVDRHLPGERESLVFAGALQLVRSTVVPKLTPADAADLTDTLTAACRAVVEVGDDRLVTAGRCVAAGSDDEGWLRDLLASDNGLGADAETRWTAVRRLVELGAPIEVISAESERDQSEQGRLASVTAAAAQPSAEAKAAAWSQMVDGRTTNRELVALAAGLWRSGQSDLVRPYLQRYIQEMPHVARARGQGYAGVVGRVFPVIPMSTDDASCLREAAETAAGSGVGGPVLVRAWRDRVDDLDVALRLR